MSSNEARQEAATSGDEPRPAAASSDSDFSLSIDQVIELYAAAGLPRDRRTIQRYCAAGKLDCRKIEIPFGDQYMVTPASAARHIAYIKEVRQAAANRGEPRPAAADVAGKNNTIEAATSTDEPRLAATEKDLSSHVAADTRVIELLTSENKFLREEIRIKNKQIADMLERSHESNALTSSLQRLLAPLLRNPDRPRDFVDNDAE